MAKRGNTLLGVVASQEQWNKSINKPGLNLFDIYSECWGPCTAIQPTFKQIQMEFGDEVNILLAETDHIDDLSQFRGTSQPLFLVYNASVPVALLKGANQPKLLELIRQCSEEMKGNKKLVNIFEDATPEEEELARTMSNSSASHSTAAQFTGFTLALVKPDAVKAGHVENIITDLNQNGLIVLAREEHTMTSEEVRAFYSHIQNEPYFLDLVTYMTSGPSIAIVLAKVTPDDRLVCDILKELRGPKDIACARQEHPDSLRARFAPAGSTGMENALHTSENKDAAAKELAFFFPNFHNENEGLERTLCVIRPDTYRQFKDDIMNKLGELGFKIALKREFVMSRDMAASFYSKHRAEPFFEALVSQMTSGPSLALALCSKDAVRTWRSYLGPKVVSEAKDTAPDSLRATFSADDVINGLHGSSSPEEAIDELNFFFPSEQTVAVIKPDMAEKREDIFAKIQEAGLVIQAEKTVNLTKDEAGEFYQEHQNKEFYGELCGYMASGESTFLVLSSTNAVEKWREIMGPTDPSIARENKPQSLRSKLGKDILRNGLHGSSSENHALKSIEMIFGQSLTIRSKSNSKSSVMESKQNTSDGITEIGSEAGTGERTEADISSLTPDTPTHTPNDTPRDTENTGSQKTLLGEEMDEIPKDDPQQPLGSSQELAKETSHEIVRITSQDMAQETSQETSHEMPHKTSQEISPKPSQEMAQETSQEINQEASHGITQETPQEMAPDTSHEEIAPETSQEMPHKTSQEMSPKPSQELAQETSQEMAPETSQETSQEMTQETPQEMAQETSQEMTPETSQEMTPETSQEMSQEASQEMSQETSQEITQEKSQEMTPETSQEMSQETSQEIAQETSQEMTPKTSQEMTQETSQEMTQERTSTPVETADEMDDIPGDSEPGTPRENSNI